MTTDIRKEIEEIVEERIVKSKTYVVTEYYDEKNRVIKKEVPEYHELELFDYEGKKLKRKYTQIERDSSWIEEFDDDGNVIDVF